MKKTICLFLTLSVVCGALSVLSGCRRTDVREVTLEIPGLTAETQAKVVEALAKYQGVDRSSYRFDLAKKTLTLNYDSMQVAQTNLRMAIQDKGVAVTFPPNVNGQ